ncbi:hypothetical protein K435DRAFT_844676 [Dendrothele bispora CBS 962.96]|uniref:Uncharacterized protein n=1 Tax=Dendrothele bispora (strain CBS 962.96) TaxID=1314807 RepID=A0A4S8L078_DENBC|nr:hypothetical protein K435DRAFT_844676 [Dendrothele bispora CBS 962.96]
MCPFMDTDQRTERTVAVKSFHVIALQASFTHYDWQNVDVKPCVPFYSRHVVLRFSKCAGLFTPEFGGSFFVASTSLTRVGPKSKKGKRKGKREKHKEIHIDSIPSMGNTKEKKDYTVPRFT